MAIETKQNERNAEVTHYNCTECFRSGVSTFRSGFIAHRKDCDNPIQPGETVETKAEPTAIDTKLNNLKTFGKQVRRTGFTKGRDQEVLDAVRGGYLSESDAMNSDD